MLSGELLIFVVAHAVSISAVWLMGAFDVPAYSSATYMERLQLRRKGFFSRGRLSQVVGRYACREWSSAQISRQP
jgi:hypothetical protein